MQATLLLSALAVGAFVASTAPFVQTFAGVPNAYLTVAADRLHQGQYPLQSGLGERTAQPQCGFAATQDWGSNGFQWCDSKNMHPQPRTYRFDALWTIRDQTSVKRK